MSLKLRGFTLIELLVVIAIIGILATVVIGAVNSARTKGADAAIKSNLQALRVEAELWYDNNNGYVKGGATFNHQACPTTYSASATNFFAGSQPSVNAIQAVNKQTPTPATAMCYAATDTWYAYAALRVQNQFGTASGADFWCVDSTGNSKVVDTAPTSGTSCG